MKKLIFALCLLLIPVSAWSAIRHVGSGQTYSTIGAAITASGTADTIVIHQGTYIERSLRPKGGTSNSVRTILISAKRYDSGSYGSESMPVVNANEGGDTQIAVFVISGVSYVTLDGLDIRGSGGHETGNVIIGDSRYSSGATSYITVQNCKLSECNVGGTMTSYNPANIRINYENDNTTNILITNNEMIGPYAAGVKMALAIAGGGNNMTITHNYMHDVVHGVVVKWGDTSNRSVEIAYNNIRNVANTNNSGRCFYMDQSYVNIHDNVCDTAQQGIYMHDNYGGTNNTISHNTFYNASYVLANGANNNAFTYNIRYGGGLENYGSGNTFSDYTSNPLFTNAAGHDFTLQAGSGAKGTADGGSDYGANISLVGIQGGGGDTTSPTITITTPTSGTTYSTSTTPLTVGGTASDNVAVTLVSYVNDRGGGANCTGTTSWSCSGITLYSGVNVINVTARDAVGNANIDTLTVTYTPSDSVAPTWNSPGFVITPTTSTSRTVPIATLSATDAVGVTGYCLKESASAPNSSTCGGAGSWSSWQASPLATYVFASDGSKTLYAWAKDAAGNVSTSLNDTITVDTVLPTITNVSSDKANGSYTTAEIIDIDVTFSEAVTSTGNVTVTLETGTTDRTCTFTMAGGTTGTCNYTVVAGDTTSDLTVKTIAGTIADAVGNAMTNFVPTTNLAANKAIVIDTTAPAISNALPSGVQACTTTTKSITRSWTTNEAATCRIHATEIVWGSMVEAGTTGGTSHSDTAVQTNGTSHTPKVVCRDALTNESAATTITYSIAADATPPTISQLSPSGQLVCTSDPRDVIRTWQTSESATCRIHATSTVWGDMAEADSTGGTSHSDTESQVCAAAYTPKIVCQDETLNESTASTISYTIASGLASVKDLTISPGGTNTITKTGGSGFIQK